MLVATVASIHATIEEVVRVHVIRARAKAQEQLAMKTSRRDGRITHLSRQKKDAENKLRLLEAGASSLFVSTISAPTSDPIRTLNVVPTPVACAY